MDHTAQMIAQLVWNRRPIRIDFSAGCPLAILLDPHGPQPCFFASGPMHSEPIRNGNFTGDVRQGGSCNAEILHWAPHCHGTHTECIGHVLAERVALLDTVDFTPGLAQLISLRAEPSGLISREQVEDKVGRNREDPIALILRTLPNPPEKRYRDYQRGPVYPVLHAAAVSWLASLPLRHLLLDTPSLDAPDNTALSNHRIWWGLTTPPQQHGYAPRRRSVTELIYVPNTLADGEYWLHFELSPILADANPSRPVVYPLSVRP